MQKHAYWIHKTKKDPHSIQGFIYLRECSCSNCGYEANMEKKVCPNCMAIMDQKELK